MIAEPVPVLEFRTPVFLPGRNITVRRGTRWLGVAEAHLRQADGGLSGAVALSTDVKCFADLTTDDLRFEHDPGCRTPSGLLQELQRIYPGFEPHESVTLVTFHLS